MATLKQDLAVTALLRRLRAQDLPKRRYLFTIRNDVSQNIILNNKVIIIIIIIIGNGRFCLDTCCRNSNLISKLFDVQVL